MRTPVFIGLASLLAGCASQPPITAPPLPVAASSKAPSCTRGAIDSTRVFIVCPLHVSTPDDARTAMKGPADLSLDILTLAEQYGVAQNTVREIEPATYARIVSTTPEVPSRSGGAGKSDAIRIEGRSFRKIELESQDQKSVAVFLEE